MNRRLNPALDYCMRRLVFKRKPKSPQTMAHLDFLAQTRKAKSRSRYDENGNLARLYAGCFVNRSTAIDKTSLIFGEAVMEEIIKPVLSC